MEIHFNIEPEGGYVSNEYMIRMVQDYIYQEKGVKVDIADPGFNSRQKGLLLTAYSWAVDHLHR